MSFTGQTYEIAAGGYRARIAEVGAGLAGVWHDGEPLTVDLPEDALPPKSCGAVLIPWPNRLRDGRYSMDGTSYQLPLSEPATHNASHGLVKWVRWQAIDHGPAEVTMTYDLVPQTGYPFPLQLRIRYGLDAGQGLSVDTEVRNVGDRAAPFGIGFHPYIDLGQHDLDHVRLEIPAASVYTLDERQLPVGRRPVTGTPYELEHIRPLGTLRLDDGFTDLTGSYALVETETRTVRLSWSAEFGYLQVFTPPFITPGRNAVAIEPMSCPADAFNSGDGLVRLEPGDGWRGSWGLALVG